MYAVTALLLPVGKQLVLRRVVKPQHQFEANGAGQVGR